MKWRVRNRRKKSSNKSNNDFSSKRKTTDKKVKKAISNPTRNPVKTMARGAGWVASSILLTRSAYSLINSVTVSNAIGSVALLGVSGLSMSYLYETKPDK